MKRTILGLAALGITSGAISSPLDDAIIAAMRLSEVPSYSWTATVQDDARSYVKEGKHIRSGYSWVTLPMLETIERRLGRAAGVDLETIFKGTEACVIRVGERWKTIRQLPRAKRGYDEAYIIVPHHTPGIVTPDMPADTQLVMDPFPPVIVVRPLQEWEDDRPYSNARLAPSPPHEELAIIVSSWANITVGDDEIKGVLTDVGARLLLCPGSEADGKPLVAAGDFTLFLKDEAVARYQVNLAGLMLVGKKEILVRQSSHTRLHDVGKSEFTVPEEARAQLEP